MQNDDNSTGSSGDVRPARLPRRGVYVAYALPADDRQQRLSVERLRVQNLAGLGHRAPHRHHVDDYCARYAREMDPVKRKAISKELLEYVASNMY